MLVIKRQIVNYKCPLTGLKVKHHVLIAKTGKKSILLSHPNLFLYSKARFSLETSNRYSNIISMFYQFMSFEPKYNEVDVTQYHAVADNNSIKRWQLHRQVERISAQKTSPTTETITNDAIILGTYFLWLNKYEYPTNVNIAEKSYLPMWKDETVLSYVRKKAIKTNDMKDIEVLDRERRQKQIRTLITKQEIEALSKSYIDPVYPALLRLAIDTAMRPIDLCQFPYIGEGQNINLRRFSEMTEKNIPTVPFTVISKGKKERTLQINLKTLQAIERDYIRPYYYVRIQKYQQRYGQVCPKSILFLNSKGIPVTAKMISSRTNDAKKAAKKLYPKLRENIKFYDARHWWPTMFLINSFKDKLLTVDSDVLFAATAQTLKNQMGHNGIETTYKHYIDFARLQFLALKGYTNELFTNPNLCITDYINSKPIDWSQNG